MRSNKKTFGLCAFWRAAILFTQLLSLAVFLSAKSAAQDALTNGGRADGTISPAGDTDSWTFSAGAGAAVMLRVGSTNFAPHIRVYNSDNVLAGEATAGSSFTRDVFVTMTATNAGTYTVLVNSTVANATGTYGLHFALIPGSFSIPAGDEGGDLANGSSNPGTISLGDLDMWSFTAAAGDSLMLRMGATDFAPWIRLYGPNGELAGEAKSPSSFTRDMVFTGTATNAGTYVAVVSSTVSGANGTYTLNLAKAPGRFIVTPGDEGGDLKNGALNSATNSLGDLDMWSFTAKAGDSLMLRMGATGFAPWIRLYDSNGALAGEAKSGSSFTRDVVFTGTATNAGTYIVVTSGTVSGDTGPYTITLAQAPGAFIVSPGDQGGELQNGALNSATNSLGDLDMWSFTAKAGDNLVLRMGATGFAPWIRLYDPNGVLAGEAKSGSSFTRDVVFTGIATNAGSYTVVTSGTVSGDNGDYTLSLVDVPGEIIVSPGDDGGVLTNGAAQFATNSVGDLDLWSFEAKAGEDLMLRMGTTDFAPWIRLYDPNGALAGEAKSGSSFTRDVVITGTATNAGTYTVVTSSTVAGDSGGYGLYLALGGEPFVTSKGDQGGPLTDGATNNATLDVGDLDMWSFVGTVGDSNALTVVATTFTPWIRLYDPSGALVGEARPNSSFTRTATLSYELTKDPGVYTVVVSASVAGQTGDYTFKQSRWAPDLIVPDGKEINEGDTLNISISAQDPDEPVKPLQFALLSGPPGAAFAIGSATNATISWPTTEADGPSTNIFTAKVTDVVNGRSFSRTNSFAIVVREVNVAPQLTVPQDQVLDELTPLNVSASATDVDIPANPLSFSLASAPAGMAIDSASGAITWTPTEEQGPSTNVVTVVVTDDSPVAVNAVHLSATNSFTVVVREINTPPVLVVPPQQAIDELQPLAISAAATDADLPANGLVFSLGAAPAGVTINPANGAIAWTPTEAQGPSTNVITVLVTDNNPLAENTKSLTVSNTVTVVVREVNAAPVLPSQQDQTIDELTPLNVVNAATDADLPANTLTYTLISAPTGAAIDASGTITWTPTEEQGPSTNTITTVVTDNGTPSLSATNSFKVIVREANTAPVLASQSTRSIDELTLVTITNAATDVDLPANTLTYTLVGAPEGATISSAGVITWTPTEAQGPSTNTITTVVTDNGSPSASATNTVIVIVREVNSAPMIQAIADQTVHYDTPVSVQVSASDSDLPANKISYSLNAPPSGATIDPNTGVISWTPTQAQAGTQHFAVVAADNGSPSLSATNTFQITVTGQGSQLGITRLSSGIIQLQITGDVGLNYEIQKSSDLKTWDDLIQIHLTTPTQLYIDPDTSASHAFYRLFWVQ